MVYNAVIEQMDADEVRNLMRISPRTLRRDSMLAARGIRELLGSPRSRFAPAPARSPQGRGGLDDDRCHRFFLCNDRFGHGRRDDDDGVAVGLVGAAMSRDALTLGE